MIRIHLTAACLALGAALPAGAQVAAPVEAPVVAPAAPVAPAEDVQRPDVAPVVPVPNIAVGTVLIEPGPGTPGADSVSGAIDASIKSGFLGQLLQGQPYTVFIPTNDALAAVPQGPLVALQGNPDELAQVVQGYTLDGNLDSDALIALAREGGGSATLESLQGTPIIVSVEGDELTINGAKVAASNFSYAGLIMHVIDGAFLPGGAAR